MSAHEVDVRALTADSDTEIALVARRMRDTLIEVLGEERGAGMYSIDWLEQRVRHHLDPDRSTGEVLVATDADGEVIGHAILRVEDEGDEIVGLLSTIYVSPGRRHHGVASALLDRGEAWMAARHLSTSVTYTHPGNDRLIRLLTERGYTATPVDDDFVRVSRQL